MGKVHLDGEAAHLGLEDGVRDVFFAEKYLFDRAYLAAENHIEVAVVDGRSYLGAGLIVVGNKGEVEPVVAGGVEVVRALFGGGDGVAQPVDLAVVFLQLLLRDGECDVELGDLEAELGLFFEDIERLGAGGGLIEDAVGEKNLGDPAVGVGVAGLVERSDLGGCIALGDEACGEVFIDAGFELLELNEDGLRLDVVGLLLGLEGAELRAGEAVVAALSHDGALKLGVQGLERGAMLGHLVQRSLLVNGVDVEIFEHLLAGNELLQEVEALFVGGGQDDGRSPGGVDRVEAHDEGVGEDAEEHCVEHHDSEDAIERDDGFVKERLPGRRRVLHWLWNWLWGRFRERAKRWCCQGAPLEVWFACPSPRSP
jgi:hypothetical protein